MLDPQKKIGKIRRRKYFTSASSCCRAKIVVNAIKNNEIKNKIQKKLAKVRVMKKSMPSATAIRTNFSLFPRFLYILFTLGMGLKKPFI
jgi:hypothetical protein